MKFMFVILLLSMSSCIVSTSDECHNITSTSIMCYNKVYDPNDMLRSQTYDPIDITFTNMKGQVNLTVPKKLQEKATENAVYKRFYIAKSCVQNIEDDFFRNLDRNARILEEITFKNVTCLTRLSTEKFRGIGAFLKKLRFESMENLSEIDDDFFDSFVSLQKLVIVNTKIRLLPEQMLTKMPNLVLLDVYSNRLTNFPWIPDDRAGLVDKIHAHKNPYDCQCSLHNFVVAMKTVLSTKTYKCATPIHLKGKPLTEVELCGQQSPLVKKVKDEKVPQQVAISNVRIEIIITVSLVTLAVVIVVIVVVLYKRHSHKKKQTPNYEQRSPSKIIFQNEADSSKALIHNPRS